MTKLSIGSGKGNYPGFITLDINPKSGADIIHDLEKFPYPFGDNECDEVFCEHVVEHLDNLIAVMEELWRITKPSGKIIVVTPHYTCNDSWVSPVHKLHLASHSLHSLETEYCNNVKFEYKVKVLGFSGLWRLLRIKWWVNSCEWALNLWETYFSFVIRAGYIRIELKPIKTSE